MQLSNSVCTDTDLVSSSAKPPGPTPNKSNGVQKSSDSSSRKYSQLCDRSQAATISNETAVEVLERNNATTHHSHTSSSAGSPSGHSMGFVVTMLMEPKGHHDDDRSEVGQQSTASKGGRAGTHTRIL